MVSAWLCPTHQLHPVPSTLHCRWVFIALPANLVQKATVIVFSLSNNPKTLIHLFKLDPSTFSELTITWLQSFIPSWESQFKIEDGIWKRRYGENTAIATLRARNHPYTHSFQRTEACSADGYWQVGPRSSALGRVCNTHTQVVFLDLCGRYIVGWGTNADFEITHAYIIDTWRLLITVWEQGTPIYD